MGFIEDCIDPPKETFGGVSIKYSQFKTVKDKALAQRDGYFRTERGSYREQLLTARKYEHFDQAFDRELNEYLLRNHYHTVMAKDNKGHHSLAGYVRQSNTDEKSIESPLFYSKPLTHKDIIFIKGREKDFPKEMEQITPSNPHPSKPGFVVFRNKPASFVSDFDKLDVMVSDLTEALLSRYMLIQTSKVMVMLKDVKDGNTMEQVLTDLVAGTWVIKVDNEFDFNDSLMTFDMKVEDRIKELTNVINDLRQEINVFFGLSTKATNKESGVSEEEIEKNDDLSQDRENVYTAGINRELLLYNLHYNTEMRVSI